MNMSLNLTIQFKKKFIFKSASFADDRHNKYFVLFLYGYYLDGI